MIREIEQENAAVQEYPHLSEPLRPAGVEAGLRVNAYTPSSTGLMIKLAAMCPMRSGG